jgi:hypothetical protein
MEVSGQLHEPAALTPGKSPIIHCIGRWVDPRTNLETLKEKKNDYTYRPISASSSQPSGTAFLLIYTRKYHRYGDFGKSPVFKKNCILPMT